MEITRPGHRPYQLNRGQADPTQEQIRQACLEIQETWSPEEKWSRLRSDWRGTFTRCDGVREEFTHDAYEGHHERPWLNDDEWDGPAD